MAETTIKAVFDAPAEKLWQILSEFGGVAKYNPLVTKVITEGTGIGSQRTCTIQVPNQDSYEIDEILDDQNDNQMSQVIKIVKAPPPFGGMVVKVQVSQIEQNKSQAEWVVNVQPGDMPEDDVNQMVKGIFVQIGDALKEYLKK